MVYSFADISCFDLFRVRMQLNHCSTTAGSLSLTVANILHGYSQILVLSWSKDKLVGPPPSVTLP